MVPTNAMAALGRRLRLGLIGGGEGALIGPVHRIAARLDDCFELVAGALSSDPERSLAQGEALGMSRVYPNVTSLLEGEARQAEPIDVVAIVTPNDTHADYAEAALSAGFHVLCEKPLSNDLASGRRIAEAVRKSGRVLCLAHNYSGYPMVREARAMIAAGEIGRVHLVQVSYLQGTLGKRVEDEPAAMPARLKWRLDPDRGGVSHVLGDIGTHAHQLATYVSGDAIQAVLADVGAVVEGRESDDTAFVIFNLVGGAKGAMLVTKAASGADNRIGIEVYGDKGGIRWEQANAGQLTVMRQGAAAELRTAGLPSLHPLALRACRLPSGHPEAFIEAFANLYRDFAELVAARLTGQEPDPLARQIPDVGDGVGGLVFVEACLQSSARGNWVSCGDEGLNERLGA